MSQVTSFQDLDSFVYMMENEPIEEIVDHFVNQYASEILKDVHYLDPDDEYYFEEEQREFAERLMEMDLADMVAELLERFPMGDEAEIWQAYIDSYC